jgi:hypothetical protein
MQIQDNPIIKQLVKDSNDRANVSEIHVTQKTTSNLKGTRLGIFQNEVDYRFLLKDYAPQLATNSRSAVDIMGFTGNAFNLVEFKLFDESKPKSYHHWSALYHLKKDIEKLEYASTFKTEYQIEYYFVFAVRNSVRTLNDDQLNKASQFIDSQNSKPKILRFNQYTVLKTIENLNQTKWPNWSFEFIDKNKDSFLLGKLKKPLTI